MIDTMKEARSLARDTERAGADLNTYLDDVENLINAVGDLVGAAEETDEGFLIGKESLEDVRRFLREVE